MWAEQTLSYLIKYHMLCSLHACPTMWLGWREMKLAATHHQALPVNRRGFFVLANRFLGS